jgi:hypothetical protein
MQNINFHKTDSIHRLPVNCYNFIITVNLLLNLALTVHSISKIHVTLNILP